MWGSYSAITPSAQLLPTSGNGVHLRAVQRFSFRIVSPMTCINRTLTWLDGYSIYGKMFRDKEDHCTKETFDLWAEDIKEA
jgi:hypothetical protein